ncbi:MAG: hypothetical protein U1F27_13360 [Turneriella sp.]
MVKRLAILLLVLGSFGNASAASTFRDAVRSMGSAGNGGAIARELVTLLNTMSEKLRYDAKSRQFFLFMNDALEDFDFARIYDSPWLTPAQDNFRSITLSGRNSGDAYTVSISPAATDFSRLGNARAEYRMRRNEIEGDKTYTAQLAFDAALKQFEAQGMARLIEGMLRVQDPDNLNQLQSPASGHFPELAGPSRKIIDQFAADFPRSTAMVSRFVELKSFAEIKSNGKKPYTEAAIRGRFRMAAVEAEYPQFRKFLKDIRNLFVLQVYISDIKGRNLASFILNAQTEEFFFSYRTQGGKILPLGKDGQPVFEDAISFSGNRDHKFYVSTNFFVNVHGLKINTGNIGAYLRYQSNADRMSFFAKITSMPEGKISGALFGILPTWLIDMSIPSDLQTLMNKFAQTAFKANGGEGTRAEVAWRKKSGQAHLNLSASTEFLDNRFIRIGMKIWVKKFRPNEGVQEDIRLFIGSFTRALLSDLSGI